MVVARRFTEPAPRTIACLDETSRATFYAVELVRFADPQGHRVSGGQYAQGVPGSERPRIAGIASLDVVEEVVWRERDAQLRHFDALDAKAGVMLGFAGALAALAPIGLNVLVEVGRALAVIGALLALVAFWPRAYGAIDLRAFRDRYLAAAREESRLRLLDTQVALAAEVGPVLRRKAKLLRTAMTSLALGALTVGAGVVIH